MYDVTALDKRMTAFVIPNAIQITTRTVKYTFTSFLSRDTTFDVIYNVWRLARPEDDSSQQGQGNPQATPDTSDASVGPDVLIALALLGSTTAENSSPALVVWDARTGQRIGQRRIVGENIYDQEIRTSDDGRTILVFVPEEFLISPRP